MNDRDDEWYWCLNHHRAEQGKVCPQEVRLGPYPSAEAAANWQKQVSERNERWDRDDARWERGKT